MSTVLYLFDNLKKTLETYLPPEQIARIEQAYTTAKNAHEGQVRSSGEPYITHPVAVAQILAEMKLDHETIMAALLHDVVEDTPINAEQLNSIFGETITHLVLGVTKLDKLQFHDHKEAQAANFRKMIMAMTSDIRVILIKLADRTHNMRTIGALRPDKRRRIAKETLEIFAPIANRLGISSIKNELEELGFEAMYPMRYRILKDAMKHARNNRKEIIKSILADINGRLEETNIKYRIQGREKHLYSIYMKMVKKEIQFHEIMDVYGFRIIVDNVDTCYRVLGQMHNLFKPRPGGFKDYIAIPKINGYQSLHTSLVGPHRIPILWIRWQIRVWPHTGSTRLMAPKWLTHQRKFTLKGGSKVCSNYSRVQATPLNLSKALKQTSFRKKFMCLLLKVKSMNYRMVQLLWTLHMPYTVTSDSTV